MRPQREHHFKLGDMDLSHATPAIAEIGLADTICRFQADTAGEIAGFRVTMPEVELDAHAVDRLFRAPLGLSGNNIPQTAEGISRLIDTSSIVYRTLTSGDDLSASASNALNLQTLRPHLHRILDVLESGPELGSARITATVYDAESAAAAPFDSQTPFGIADMQKICSHPDLPPFPARHIRREAKDRQPQQIRHYLQSLNPLQQEIVAKQALELLFVSLPGQSDTGSEMLVRRSELPDGLQDASLYLDSEAANIQPDSYRAQAIKVRLSDQDHVANPHLDWCRDQTTGEAALDLPEIPATADVFDQQIRHSSPLLGALVLTNIAGDELGLREALPPRPNGRNYPLDFAAGLLPAVIMHFQDDLLATSPVRNLETNH